MSTVINGKVNGSVLSGTFVGETNIGSIDHVYVVTNALDERNTIVGIYTSPNLAYESINYDLKTYEVKMWKLNIGVS